MENKPAKRSKSWTTAKILLAGVFLALALSLSLAWRATIDLTPAAAGVSSAVIAGSGSGLLGSGAAYAAQNGNEAAAAPPEASAAAAPARVRGAAPVRLIIPSLGVDAAVEAVGLHAAGDMRAPDNAFDVAWYDPGPAPGQAGSAVIAGHINTRYSAHGVFEHLGDLNSGDKVEVQTASGAQLTFTVTGKQYLAYNAPAPLVFAAAGEKNLNLITCAGTWMPAKHVYDERLVVFAALQ